MVLLQESKVSVCTMGCTIDRTPSGMSAVRKPAGVMTSPQATTLAQRGKTSNGIFHVLMHYAYFT